MKDKLNMIKKISIISLAIFLSVNTFSFSFAKTKAPTKTKSATVQQVAPQINYELVDALDLVKNPKNYLNKNIKISATFDKFSTIGLDYQPAFRDSQKYISFLIRRDDIQEHKVPLSELKLIIKRDYAEKQILDIEAGDKIEIRGKVFSTALNDPWVDVAEVIILSPKKEKKSL